ncbi:hypothetical protein IMZ48_35665 [Candidatus Bathyarchaeota archaeon]|nr:hypothetical protein [Candidatus Bathyarchaeota archaeon]
MSGSDHPSQGSQFHASQGGQDSQPATQYAEFDPNTAPQVRVESAPEVVVPPIEPDVAHQPSGNAPPQAAVGKTQDRRGCWARLEKRTKILFIGWIVAACIILTVCLTVPIVLEKNSRSMVKDNGKSPSGPDSPTMTDSPASSPTVSYHPIPHTRPTH